MDTLDFGDGLHVAIKRNRQAKRLRIVIHQDGSVVMTLPLFVSYKKGKEFLSSKIDWIREKIKAFSSRTETLLHRGSPEEYAENRVAAQKLIMERLDYVQRFYNVSWKRVSVRNQKTRWGSCSRRGNLSFNYRLLFLPSHLVDYVIAHEICHLIEFNHSPKFWVLVAKTFPDYRELRQELRLL